MTNFEKWKDEILEITNHGTYIAVVNGKPVTCEMTNCNKCELGIQCNVHRFNWLYEEYKEPIKLTKRERAFCEAFEYPNGYRIARNSVGNLSLGGYIEVMELDNTWFQFIKAGSPFWRVEDLLKLEVEE